jgi:hypothetical protein
MSSRHALFCGLALALAAVGAGLAGGAATPPSTAGRSLRLPATAAAEVDATAPAAPVSLTASDGTGLRLVALDAQAVLEPPLAFTELHLTFENPSDRVIEGRFRIAMPPGATLSRLAMKIGSGWQEGEVVERQRARVAYEDFLHRRQDPALLEQEAGNEFSARVFPIGPHSKKELIVSYSQALTGVDEPYVLPLLGLPEVGSLRVRVLLGQQPASDTVASNLGGEVTERRVVALERTAWTPDRDLVVPQDRVARRAGLRSGNLALLRLAAPVDVAPQEIAGLYVLVDSSASRALGWPQQVRRVGQIAAALAAGAGADAPLGVAAFDQVVGPIHEGRAGDFGAREVVRLGQRRPLGASDLVGALDWLAGRLREGTVRTPRVLLVTDGIATAGDTEGQALRAAVAALGAHGVERLDVLAVGGLRDDAALSLLVTGNLRHDGQRLDGDAPLAEIARRLTTASRSGLKVALEGASWVWPETLDGVQPGDAVLVTAELPAGTPLRLTVDGRPVALDGEVGTVERPLLARVWAQGRIQRLLHLRETAMAGDVDLRRALEREATELSVEHRVLTPLTAFLVLETEADYARFDLDRRGLADILTVGAGGIEVLARSAPSLPPPVVPEEKPGDLMDRIAVGGDTAGDGEVMGRSAASPPPPASEPMATQPAEIAEGDATFHDLDSFEEVVVTQESPRPDAGEVETGVMVGQPGGVPGGTPGGIPDAVPGGVVGSVAGGVAGGTVGGAPSPAAADSVSRRGGVPRDEADDPRQQAAPEADSRRSPWSGRYGEVKAHLTAGRIAQARTLAEAWQAETPGDVLALLALGEAWQEAGETASAARAYGSLIDLFPSRADIRRLAGQRLERLGPTALPLAVDTYRKAVLQRPDHPSGHRLLAWAQVLSGDCEGAFATLDAAIARGLTGGRFLGVERILREDLGLIAAAWLHHEPKRREEIRERTAARGARIADEPSLRFVLTWETDANDVDLHVYDARGGHASFQSQQLPSGGELFADVTNGYGPECFAIVDPAARRAGPYRLQAHYYSRGPMGYGMGVLHVVSHDGRGGMTVEARPFVVMEDRAMLELGEVEVRTKAK